ncbi:hypothetical protein HanXRQr2_Chr09g0399901 [Helianthus annuus]|uniref:Uncharacterized protein n=1 Tax=Helianthus annuus TaxID=4232 RepID=A0A9K3N939_HELAN|nr:hypothetical protein HanXRQr2_Chr09g0399901 [Helianthus annuus]
MATPDVLPHDHFSSSSFDHTKGDAKSRGLALEKKIEYLESLNDRVILICRSVFMFTDLLIVEDDIMWMI